MPSSPNKLLLAMLRAAHCRSTHHYFAIDALPLIGTEPGQRLAAHLLRHHYRYLRGAKDPDTRFRDFQNHVIHVDEGYWGGAPRVAHQWYDRMQRYLRTDRWSDAAYAAGVLSHYFTDPIQPLHTMQVSAVKALHRPIEWSVTRSYDSLLKQWQEDPSRTVYQLSDAPGWLGEAILTSAKVASEHHGTLLQHYDLQAARISPKAGLDSVSRGCLAQLIGLCVTGWARVLERAALDAETSRGEPLPRQGTSLALLLAGVRMPSGRWLRRIEYSLEQRKINALIDEFETTGQVVKNLPSELRVLEKVRVIHSLEQEYNRRRAERQNDGKVQILGPSQDAEPALPASRRESPSTDTSAPALGDKPVDVAAEDAPVVTVPFVSPTSVPTHLNVEDPFSNAPSIGRKTAARFAQLGINTVGDFLSADPAQLVKRLATAWITTDTLHAWRCQAILMCQLPEMLAHETQLLVGAGFTTADSIAKAKPEALLVAVQSYCATYSGQRYLGGAEPPDRQRVDAWIGEAALALVRQKRTLARQRAAAAAEQSEQSKRVA